MNIAGLKILKFYIASILIMTAGLLAGFYLVKNPQILKGRADVGSTVNIIQNGQPVPQTGTNTYTIRPGTIRIEPK